MIKTVTAAINRRALLLGLASASTVAAAGTTATAAAPSENPALVALGEQVGPAVAEYLAAGEAARVILANWSPKWPEAPEELFVYWGNEYERDLSGWVVYRRNEYGEMRARHIITASELERRVDNATDHVRRARTEKSKARAQEELDEYSALLSVARGYEAAKEAVRVASGYPAAKAHSLAALTALADLVGRIMDERADTMTGVAIKAEALAAFGRHTDGMDMSLNTDWRNKRGPVFWGQQLAASMIEVATVAAANGRA